MFFKQKKSVRVFKETVYVHLEFLYNIALKYTSNPADAEDIVQETLLIAFDKFDQLRDKARAKAWLFRILRNLYLKSRQEDYTPAMRREDCGSGYIEMLEDESGDSDAQTLLTKAVDAEELHMSMDQLPEKYKTVLVLYYMEEMRYSEIASFLEIPIGTVMSRLTRARSILKKSVYRRMHQKKTENTIIFLNKKVAG
jgi:RNA polymerase sigma-70 factor (ECF subfamily)